MGIIIVKQKKQIVPVLNNAGEIVFGKKHLGHEVARIAQSEPNYLEWMLDKVEMSPDDEESIRKALSFYGH